MYYNKFLISVVFMALAACDYNPIRQHEFCDNHEVNEGGQLGAGAYPEPNTAYGEQCHCTAENYYESVVVLNDLELSGDAGLPEIVNIDIPSMGPTPVVPNPVSGSYENQLWSASFADQVNPLGEDYDGTWHAYLSRNDLSTGGEVACEADPYATLFYWEEDRYDPPKGKKVRPETRAWSCPVGVGYTGDFVLGTMPGQPARRDGSVLSHLFLADGDPRVVGLKPRRLQVLDPGGATAVVVDGHSYPLAAGAEIPLPRGSDLWQDLPVIYAEEGGEAPKVRVSADCLAPSFGAVRSPTYAVPSTVNGLFGLDQPAVVTVRGSGAERVLMLEAVGLGLRRGLRVDANGRFQRAGEVDGLALSGVVVRQDSKSLVLRIEALSLDGVALLPVATTFTLAAAG